MKKIILIILVLVSCVGCDQTTKEIASQNLSEFQIISYMHDVFRLQYTENTGAFLSLGSGLTDNVKFWVFTVSVAIVLLATFTYILVVSSRISKTTLIGVSMIIGGGISNLIDRMVNNGAVIDFMNIGIGGLRTGIFNFADVAITTGAVMLILFHRGCREKPSYELG